MTRIFTRLCTSRDRRIETAYKNKHRSNMRNQTHPRSTTLNCRHILDLLPSTQLHSSIGSSSLAKWMSSLRALWKHARRRKLLLSLTSSAVGQDRKLDVADMLLGPFAGTFSALGMPANGSRIRIGRVKTHVCIWRVIGFGGSNLAKAFSQSAGVCTGVSSPRSLRSSS